MNCLGETIPALVPSALGATHDEVPLMVMEISAQDGEKPESKACSKPWKEMHMFSSGPQPRKNSWGT